MNQVTITRRGEKYVASFRWSIETKDALKATGFRFDPARKEWWTDSEDKAAVFAPQVAAKVKAEVAKIVNAELPVPSGLAYLPFQQDGIRELIVKKQALLADQMGLGKTIQVIGLINAVPTINKVLIICPASLKLNWQSELFRWSHRSMSVIVLNSGDTFVPCDIVIINYEQVAKYRAAIDKVQWDLLVCDESHYLKNSKSQRTVSVMGRWANEPANRVYPIKAARRVLITGTPILNRPVELWTTVRALDRAGLGANWEKYVRRYCAGYQAEHGWQVNGSSNLAELQDRLRSSIMIRRSKDQVLKELPPKRRQVILLPSDSDAMRRLLGQEAIEVVDAEREILRLRAIVEALPVDQTNAEFRRAVAALESYENVAFHATAVVRHKTALAKLIPTMDHLANVLQAEEKVVVFAHHHDVIDGVKEGLAEFGVVVIDGRVALEDRKRAVDRFQEDPNCRVMIGSIQAAGVGITLTAASYCAFAELDWVPGNLMQAEDRLHRIGQHDSVLVQYLMLQGSFDGRMANSVIHKMAVVERALG
jgi:SWI/SNF-related matrix-associated actin-dependent regulator 1 of chromatin subfamily A